MDPNNNPFNTQNSQNFSPFNYNPNDFNLENQSSNQPRPQNVSNPFFPPNFMPSAVPNFMPSGVQNWNPYAYPMQFQPPQPHYYPNNPQMPRMRNEISGNSQPLEFPEFSTQLGEGSISAPMEDTPPEECPTPHRKKNTKWMTAQNLVLLSGYIKYGTDSVIGNGQKSDAFWGKITNYCNDYGSFDSTLSLTTCKNRYNYICQKVGKWIGAYDSATRMKQSGWSETDVLKKAQELYTSGGNGTFNLMDEWRSIRDQPRFASMVGGNTGSASSGSKRSRESDGSDSNSVGSIPRPMGRDSTKKKGKKKNQSVGLSPVKEGWTKYQTMKQIDWERLDKISTQQEESNNIQQEIARAKKMKVWVKLSMKDNRDEQQQRMFEMLSNELF